MRFTSFRAPPPSALARWARRAISPNPAPRYHDVDEVHVASVERASRRIESYDTYPRDLLLWSGELREGGTLVQRVKLGPVAVEAGVRVLKLTPTSLRYATLEGHPEVGVADFSLVGETFRIESWSGPSRTLRALGQARNARRLQRRAVRSALAGVSA